MKTKPSRSNILNWPPQHYVVIIDAIDDIGMYWKAGDTVQYTWFFGDSLNTRISSTSSLKEVAEYPDCVIVECM